jgi:hypothetical protein
MSSAWASSGGLCERANARCRSRSARTSSDRGSSIEIRPLVTQRKSTRAFRAGQAHPASSPMPDALSARASGRRSFVRWSPAAGMRSAGAGVSLGKRGFSKRRFSRTRREAARVGLAQCSVAGATRAPDRGWPLRLPENLVAHTCCWRQEEESYEPIREPWLGAKTGVCRRLQLPGTRAQEPPLGPRGEACPMSLLRSEGCRDGVIWLRSLKNGIPSPRSTGTRLTWITSRSPAFRHCCAMLALTIPTAFSLARAFACSRRSVLRW